MDLEARIAALERDLEEARALATDYRDRLDRAAVAVSSIGSDGVIQWASQAELDLLGYRNDEYAGRHIRDFHADAHAASEILDSVNGGRPLVDYQTRLRGKDGSIRHVLISSSPGRGHDGLPHTRLFTRDITERTRYEQRVRIQADIAPALMNSPSLEDAGTAVVRVICNHTGCRAGFLWTVEEDHLRCASSCLLGRLEGEADAALGQGFTLPRGVGWPGRVWNDCAPLWISDLQAGGKLRRPQLNSVFGFRSGFAFPLTLEGNVLGVMEFFANEALAPDPDLLQLLTTLGSQIAAFIERSSARRRLAETEESYRVLAETAIDGVVTIGETGAILFVNSAASAMFGYGPNELKGSPVQKLIPEEPRGQRTPALPSYLAKRIGGASSSAVPLVGEHRHGHEIPLEVSFGEYDGGGRPIFVGILRDVTERNRLEEKLRQTARLESLGVLAGGIAHDFNNLLTGILGNVSLALEAAGETAPRTHPMLGPLQNALDASERAAHLTRQLLAYAGKGRYIVEPTDISHLIRDISTLVGSSIPKHVRLRLDLQQPLPLVDADVAQMQQLIMNLVINAAEAIPEGTNGLVLVTASAHELEEDYLRQTSGDDDLSPGPYVVINVHDNGTGMDRATAQRIFDPFFTTKFTGRGLGLAAALGIIRGHKGGLRVFSAPGQGTTFKVLLRVSNAIRELDPAHCAVRKTDKGSGTVLVVDDEPVVRKVAATALERYGYKVVTAENGREGVERFAELHASLSAVILDMTMPVMSGDEALRRMRSISQSVPVLLSSGYSETEAMQRFPAGGLAGFIQKPYRAAALVEKIRTVLELRIRRMANQ